MKEKYIKCNKCDKIVSISDNIYISEDNIVKINNDEIKNGVCKNCYDYHVWELNNYFS